MGKSLPLALVTARWAGVVLLIALFMRGPLRRDWPGLKRHWRFVAAMGAAGFTLFNAVFYIAAHSTTAINLGIIQGAIPVFVMVGSYLLYKEKITVIQALGVVVTLIGVVVVVTRGSLERLVTLTVNDGDFLMLLAAFLYASFAIGLRRKPPVSTLGLFSAMAIVAFFVSLPFTVGEMVVGTFLAPTPLGWLIVLLVTIFPSLRIADLLHHGGREDRAEPGRGFREPSFRSSPPEWLSPFWGRIFRSSTARPCCWSCSEFFFPKSSRSSTED